MVLKQADTAGHEKLVHVQVPNKRVIVRPSRVMEAQEVELDAKELGYDFAEAIEQHFRRHFIGRQHRREAEHGYRQS